MGRPLTAPIRTFVSSHDGTRLRLQYWAPAAKLVGRVQLLHGLGDHAAMHVRLLEALRSHGYGVAAVDLRGHGESSGQRAYVKRWQRYHDDVQAGANWLAEEFGAGRRSLVGISMGALLALDVTLQSPAQVLGVAAAGTPLGRTGVPGWLMALGRVASVVYPRFSLRTGLPLDRLAHDETVRNTMLADPLFHRVGTARLSTEITGAMKRVRNDLAALSRPALLLHGSDDALVPPEPVRKAVATADNPAIQYAEIAGGWHALFEDGTSAPAVATLVRWLERLHS